MRITDIYRHYTIMDSLQLHMLRVAGVADMICNHITVPVDRAIIITSCLLHDMGNIIKFKLDLFPTFLEPEGYDYWQGIKNSFIAQYGTDEHEATLAIVHEIGVNDEVSRIIDAIGFSDAEMNNTSQNMNQKIAVYADMRVEPMGVTSLQERLLEGNRRYKLNRPDLYSEEALRRMTRALTSIEHAIFAHCDIIPNDITEETIQPIIAQLKEYDVVDATI